MIGATTPLTHETGDTGYSGDTFRQEPEFTGVWGAAPVPGSPGERGHEPGTLR